MKKKIGMKVPTDLGGAAIILSKIAKHQTAIEHEEVCLNKTMNRLRAKAQPKINKHQQAIQNLLNSLFIFAEENRSKLTYWGKRKSVKIATGSFGWRLTPIAVTIQNAAEIIQELKRRKLLNFIRIKETVNKEAILKRPTQVADIRGISISQREEFRVKPSRITVEIVSGIRISKKRRRLNKATVK
ncbi:MAG: host-nuclease inhibitor Gam family protein [Patescibacteria group bacterium]